MKRGKKSRSLKKVRMKCVSLVFAKRHNVFFAPSFSFSHARTIYV